MNLNADKSRLAGTTRQLFLEWENAKIHWRDQKSQEFEKKYLEELFVYADKTIQVIEKLDELLKKVRSDCE
jgi:hypothetical protein